MVLGSDELLFTILACASLSVLGCFFIITCSLVFKELRTYTFRLITYLAIADFFGSISNEYEGYLIPGYQDWKLCLAQAMIQNYSQVTSLFITGIISFSLYEMIVQNNNKIPENENIFVFASFSIPILLTPLPLITNSYGDSNGWCWIKYDHAVDTFWMFFEFYAFLFILFIVNIFFYSRIYQCLAKDGSLIQNQKLVTKVMKRVKWYPIVLLVCFGASAVRRIYYLFGTDDVIWLDLASGSCSALYGFTNVLVYGMTSKVRSVIRKAVFRRQSSARTPKKKLELIT